MTRYLHPFCYTMLVVLYLANVVYLARSLAKESFEADKTRYRLEKIVRTTMDLQNGSGRISAYSTGDTDEFLWIFASRPEVQHVGLEQTDVSASGLRAIATMPNLQSLSLLGSRLTPEEAQVIGEIHTLQELNLYIRDDVADAKILEQLRRDLPEAEIKNKY